MKQGTGDLLLAAAHHYRACVAEKLRIAFRVSVEEWFSNSVRPQPGKYFSYTTRARRLRNTGLHSVECLLLFLFRLNILGSSCRNPDFKLLLVVFSFLVLFVVDHSWLALLLSVQRSFQKRRYVCIYLTFFKQHLTLT
jgi:hypothetical protein